MKKGRPGLKLSVLLEESKRKLISDFVLEHTSTIGLRYHAIERTELPRRLLDVATPYGPIKVKEVTTPAGHRRFKIEHESLRALSQQHQRSISFLQQELYAFLQQAPPPPSA